MTFQTDFQSANVKESPCTKITTACYIVNDTFIRYLYLRTYAGTISLFSFKYVQDDEIITYNVQSIIYNNMHFGYSHIKSTRSL